MTTYWTTATKIILLSAIAIAGGISVAVLVPREVKSGESKNEVAIKPSATFIPTIFLTGAPSIALSTPTNKQPREESKEVETPTKTPMEVLTMSPANAPSDVPLSNAFPTPLLQRSENHTTSSPSILSILSDASDIPSVAPTYGFRSMGQSDAPSADYTSPPSAELLDLSATNIVPSASPASTPSRIPGIFKLFSSDVPSDVPTSVPSLTIAATWPTLTPANDDVVAANNAHATTVTKTTLVPDDLQLSDVPSIAPSVQAINKAQHDPSATSGAIFSPEKLQKSDAPSVKPLKDASSMWSKAPAATTFDLASIGGSDYPSNAPTLNVFVEAGTPIESDSPSLVPLAVTSNDPTTKIRTLGAKKEIALKGRHVRVRAARGKHCK
ncbi:hypothetical protein MPSEU_000754600 [Mayamaea pseudoterrestris]|nr:hypothetical protein MPSEU_000754600 [Mayamaea pseudoterrestris]